MHRNKCLVQKGKYKCHCIVLTFDARAVTVQKSYAKRRKVAVVIPGRRGPYADRNSKLERLVKTIIHHRKRTASSKCATYET